RFWSLCHMVKNMINRSEDAGEEGTMQEICDEIPIAAVRIIQLQTDWSTRIQERKKRKIEGIFHYKKRVRATIAEANYKKNMQEFSGDPSCKEEFLEHRSEPHEHWGLVIILKRIKHDLLLHLKDFDAGLDMHDNLPQNWNERYTVERESYHLYHMEEILILAPTWLIFIQIFLGHLFLVDFHGENLDIQSLNYGKILEGIVILHEKAYDKNGKIVLLDVGVSKGHISVVLNYVKHLFKWGAINKLNDQELTHGRDEVSMYRKDMYKNIWKVVIFVHYAKSKKQLIIYYFSAGFWMEQYSQHGLGLMAALMEEEINYPLLSNVNSH
ncbi:hypothetical protein ACJX0J_025740, partial [Zea mays]